MRGGKQLFKMTSSLRRGQLYFIVIALMMTLTLFFLTYGWNFSEKLSRLSNHKSLIPATRLVAPADHRENTTTAYYNEENRKRTSLNASQYYNESRKVLKFTDSMFAGFINTSHTKKDLTKQLSKDKHVDYESTVSSTTIYRSSTLKALNDRQDKAKATGSGPSKHTDKLIQTTKIQDIKQTQDSQTTDDHIVEEFARNNHTHGKHPKEQGQKVISTKSFNKTGSMQDKIDHLQTRGNVLNKETAKVENKNAIKATRVISVDKSSVVNTDLIRKDVNNVNKPMQVDSTRDGAMSTISNHNSTLIAGGKSGDKMFDNQLQTQNIPKTDNETTGERKTTLSKEKHATNDQVINGDGEKVTTGAAIKTKERDSKVSDQPHDRMKERLSNRRRTDRPGNRKSPGKGFHRFETVSFNHNLLQQLKHGLWNPGMRRPQTEMRGAYTIRPDVCRGCFKTAFTQLIDSPNICKTHSDIQVLIMISSAPGNQEARDVIRNTWGKVCYDKNSAIKCVYVFGEHRDSDINKALVEENKNHKDVIQYAFQDTYANLTYKTMVSLKWASENCQKAKYVMKTDDDMYLNTELLPLMLQGAPDSRFFGGFCWGPSSPHRDMSSKWYVSFEQFSQPMYPKMCSGTGYVMSYDVLLGVLRQSADIPFFYLEDVYVSLCLKRLGIQPILLNGFSNAKVEYEPCSFRNQVITSHAISAIELQHIWPEIQRCPKENLTPDMVYFPKYFR